MYSVELSLLLLSDTWQLQLHDFPLWPRVETCDVVCRSVRSSFPCKDDMTRPTAQDCLRSRHEFNWPNEHGKSIFYSQELKRELILWQTCEMFVYWSEFLWLKHPASQISQLDFCVPLTLLPHRISAQLGYENMKRSVFWCFLGLRSLTRTQNDPDISWYFLKLSAGFHAFRAIDFQGTLGWLEQSMQLQSPETWYLTDGAENWDLPSQLCQRCALMPKYAKVQSEIQASTSRDIQCPDAARKLGSGLVGFKQMGDNSQTQCPRLPPAKHGAMFS